ncbi:MAG: hypothetical protein NZ823_15470 [Blastocatellia bacterium]|nr:hypothetical protein [Blastocatellia bacterium]
MERSSRMSQAALTDFLMAFGIHRATLVSAEPRQRRMQRCQTCNVWNNRANHRGALETRQSSARVAGDCTA